MENDLGSNAAKCVRIDKTHHDEILQAMTNITFIHG